MLNVTNVRREVHTENLLVVGVDVSKDKLDLYAEHIDSGENCRQELDGQIPNRNEEIEAMLRELAGYAEERSLEGLLVVCEPTGGYEDPLMETARCLGHETAYANGEHVSKASVIESGDPGKTDEMDARVIAMIGQIDKTQEQRVLDGEHALLRELGRMYEAEDEAVVRARCRLDDLLRKLFCDLEKENSFVFTNTGTAVAEIYGWNPQTIVEDGFERFRQKMKEKVKGVHESTLQDLWDQAQRSVRQQMPSARRELLERRVRQLWADYTRHEARKKEIAARMEALFKQLRRKGEAPDRIENLDAAMMGRLLGESGPLSDFDHEREVLHYSGLNLYERESGTYKGETKISKACPDYRRGRGDRGSGRCSGRRSTGWCRARDRLQPTSSENATKE